MSGKVIVFGSCNMDVFMDVPSLDFFCATGKGAEDGLHIEFHKQAAGGKGANQAVAAVKAGGKVSFYGAIGSGAHARFLLENFKALKINVSGLVQMETPTGMAVIFIKPNGKHKMVVSHGANMLAKSKQVPDRDLKQGNILVLQAETDLKENAALLKRAQKLGATTIYNVAPAVPLSPKELKLIDYLIMNEAEAQVVADNLGLPAMGARDLAQVMAKNYGLTCIITLGERGVVACDGGAGNVVCLPTLKVKAIDSVGAGDAFVGAFSAALARKDSPEEALLNGIVAGALACTRLGAQTALPSAAEIAKRLPALRKMIKK